MNTSQVGVLNSDEAGCLGVSIVLTLLGTRLFFTDAPPVQQDSVLLMLQNLLASGLWLASLYAMTALIAVTAIGKLHAPLCSAGCCFLMTVIGFIFWLT
jgi:hypothetical protein